MYTSHSQVSQGKVVEVNNGIMDDTYWSNEVNQKLLMGNIKRC